MCVTNTVRRPKAIALPKAKLTNAVDQISNRSIAAPSIPMFSTDVFRDDAWTDPFSDNAWSAYANTPTFSEPASKCQRQRQRPKRKRKPQKPGKTAKMNERHFVVHTYHDHARDSPDGIGVQQAQSNRRGGVSVSFPIKLHAMLDQIEADGLAYVISWQVHGRAFQIHDPKEFVSHVMPKYFRQTKLTSFQRQLNLYGFCRLTKGADNRGYYHELFLRGKSFLCKKMIRVKVKGTGFKAASSPEQEPDFYSMPPVLVTPPSSGLSDSDYSDSDEETKTREAVQPPSEVYSFSRSPMSSFNETFSFNVVPVSPLHRPEEPIYQQQQQQQLLVATPSMEIEQVQSEQSDKSIYQGDVFDAALQSIYEGDLVLDEALEELFAEDQNVDSATVEDFVQIWGSTTSSSTKKGWQSPGVSFDVLDSDYQLGCLLEMFMTE